MAKKEIIAKGIDVSHWQKTINFEKVKNAGIDFVIIKCGGSDKGFYKDSKFEQNYANAKKAGLHVGTYYFVGKGCVTRTDGVADAKRFVEQIKGKQFEYPIVMDVEVPSPSAKNGITEACKGFCEYLESCGYYAMIYGSDISGFKERMDVNQLVAYDKWVARYGKKEPSTPHGIWQYSSSGKVDGIGTYVDMDYAYKDYPSTMKKHHLNGY